MTFPTTRHQRGTTKSRVRAPIVAALCTAIAALGLAAAAPSAQAATDAHVVVQLDQTTAAYGTPVNADVTAVDASQQPSADAAVVVHATPTTPTPTAVAFNVPTTTDADGHARVPLPLHAATWTITATLASTTSAPATAVITPATVTMTATAAPVSVISRGLSTLTATLQSPTVSPALLADSIVLVYALVQPDKTWHVVDAVRGTATGGDGNRRE